MQEEYPLFLGYMDKSLASFTVSEEISATACC